MADIFKDIKDRLAMPDVAKILRIADKSFGNGVLSFHEERTPSLKVYEDHFYCFGCGATGDCTGFVATLFGITQFEAAKKISYDFGLNLFNREIAVPVNKALQAENDYRMWLKKREILFRNISQGLQSGIRFMFPNFWRAAAPVICGKYYEKGLHRISFGSADLRFGQRKATALRKLPR